jgi:hypothetical protein
LVLAGFAILSVGALLPVPALASEGMPPRIETVTVQGYASGEVVMDAAISPEGSQTSYKITWDCPGEKECQQTEGLLLPDHEEYNVRLELTGLQAGSTYSFGIYARSTAGEAAWPGEFTVPWQHEFWVQLIPPGACPNGCKDEEVYTPPELPWANESGRLAAAKTLQEAREEQQAKEAAAAKEREEAKAREAAVLASEKAARKHREEAEQSSAPACVVPTLRGDTLSAARHALAKAHCRLGKVGRPARRDSRLLIIRQNARHGMKLPAGAAVAVTLGSAHRPRG